MSDQVEKPVKKRINSKKKGSGFEGHVGKVLAEALKPMKFRRSQSSGAILGGVNKKFLEAYSEEARSLFVGDVVPTNESDVIRDEGWRLRFSLECKFYKTADNIDHMFGNTKIKGFFEQAMEDAEKLGKDPLLIFKFNRTETFCAILEGTRLPRNISRTLTLVYNESTDQKPLAFTMFLFKEALADPEWFKEKWPREDPAVVGQRLHQQMQQNNPNPPIA